MSYLEDSSDASVPSTLGVTSLIHPDDCVLGVINLAGQGTLSHPQVDVVPGVVLRFLVGKVGNRSLILLRSTAVPVFKSLSLIFCLKKRSTQKLNKVNPLHVDVSVKRPELETAKVEAYGKGTQLLYEVHTADKHIVRHKCPDDASVCLLVVEVPTTVTKL